VSVSPSIFAAVTTAFGAENCDFGYGQVAFGAHNPACSEVAADLGAHNHDFGEVEGEFDAHNAACSEAELVFGALDPAFGEEELELGALNVAIGTKFGSFGLALGSLGSANVHPPGGQCLGPLGALPHTRGFRQSARESV
jgi:hypothetical protein